MNTSKKCPKCDCSHLEKFSGSKSSHGSRNFIRLSLFSSVIVDKIVCMDCGHCEEWVSPRGLAILRSKRGYGASR